MNPTDPSQNTPQLEAKPDFQQPSETTLQTPTGPDQTPKTKPWLLLMIITIVILSLGTTGFLAYQNYQLKKQVSTPQPPSSFTPTTSPAITNITGSEREISQISKKIFPYVDENILKIEKDVPISPSEGFTIISSFLSPNKAMLAFSEVSNCFNPDYVSCSEKANYDPNIKCQTCEVVYRLSIKNLETDKIQLLYEFPKNGSSKELTKGFFFDRLLASIVKPVYAGARLDYILFPYAWTADSKTLIAKDGVFQSAPIGGLPDGYFLINLETKKIQPLGDIEILFSSNFSKAIKLETSNNFPYNCGPMSGTEYGDKIVVINLLNGETIKLIEGNVYSLKEINENGTKLKYYFMTKQEADQYIKDHLFSFCGITSEYFKESVIDLP